MLADVPMMPSRFSSVLTRSRKNQANFFRHALQQQAHLFHAKRLLDVVISAKLHGIDCGFDGAVAGHNGHFRTRQQALDLPQEFDARLGRELEVGQHEVRYIRIEAREGSFRAFRFDAGEPQ